MNHAISLEDMTIEHLTLQSVGTKTWEPDDVGAIGNLIFVTKETNGKLDDKAFPDKVGVIALEAPWAGASVTGAAKWTRSDIKDRGYEQAKLGRESVWKL